MIGNKILRFETLDSTNNFAKVNAKSLEHGTVICSAIQSLGRGRKNRKWESEKGNLYFSFILSEGVSRTDIFKYVVNTSVTINRLLKGFSVFSEIKYPNDILVENKKICGILMESYGSLEIDYVVIGVGININQSDFSNLSNNATSIKNETNMTLDIDKVLNKFIHIYNKIESISFNEVFEEYLDNSLVIGKKIKLDSKTYHIKGIHENGNLILTRNGEIEYRSFNEITLSELYQS